MEGIVYERKQLNQVLGSAQASQAQFMGKPKLLMIAYRAYGDWVYTFPVLPYLFEKYDVYADVNVKGFQLLHDDPRFKHLSMFEMEKFPMQDWARLANERIEKLKEDIPHDKFINFNHSLESVTVLVHAQPEFFHQVGDRRSTAGSRQYYEAVFERAEIPFPKDRLITDTIHFSQEQEDWGKKWRFEHHAEHFVVVVAVAGTGMQKVFREAVNYIKWVLITYPDAHIYVAGDRGCWNLVKSYIKSDRVYDICNETNMKQSFLITKYADYVVGGETGLVAAAGMFGTPKTMLCTSSGVAQVNSFQNNDFSLQASVWCSPCVRAIYVAPDCEYMLTDSDNKPIRPACVDSFKLYDIQERTDHVYRNLRKRIPARIPEAGAVGAR